MKRTLICMGIGGAVAFFLGARLGSVGETGVAGMLLGGTVGAIVSLLLARAWGRS